MRTAPALLVLLILSTVASAQDESKVRFIGRPDTAIQLAVKDCEAVLAQDPDAFPWYIWIRDSKDDELIDVYDYVLNTTMSRADHPVRSVKVYGGSSGALIRVDLNVWLPKLEHKFNFLRIIEGYYDPTFYIETGEKHKVTIPSPSFILKNKTFNHVKFNLDKFAFHPALQGPGARLQQLTGLTVPIVEGERWLVDSLRVLNGGLYYKLQGLDTFVGNKQKRLNQKEWLDTYGADEERSAELNGEEYIGLWRSDVTGKPRRGKFLFGTATRPSVGAPLIVITEDGADEDLETEQHPMYSLFDFEFAATEILATKPNGAIGYALFAGDGTLQDSAPDNIVTDHKVPAPHTQRLEPAISCIRCHAVDSQWKPMPNEVKTLLSENVEVVTDFSRDPHEVQHQLRSLYSGDLTIPLKSARTSHEFAVIKMVDFKLEGDGYAVEAAERTSRRYNKYVYDPVDAVEALRTLGLVVPKEAATREFKHVVPTKGLIDPAVASLGLGIEINRTDWERVYPAVFSTALAHGEIVNEPKNPD